VKGSGEMEIGPTTMVASAAAATAAIALVHVAVVAFTTTITPIIVTTINP
jgi:hypothetical protein